MRDISSAHQTLGADIRALRRSRGLTLKALATQLNKSVGWMSQVERDLSEPTISDLRDFARVLDIPLSMLSTKNTVQEHDQGFVVRKNNRRSIGRNIQGLTEELLSPDLTDDFEVVYSHFAPHSRIKTPVSRPTQEVGFLISGTLNLTIDGREYIINQGDSFRIRGEEFSWANPYNDPAIAIWVIAPPVY